MMIMMVMVMLAMMKMGWCSDCHDGGGACGSNDEGCPVKMLTMLMHGGGEGR